MLVLVLVLAGERPGGSPRARRGGGRALPACSGLLAPVWFVVRWDRLAPKRRFLSGRNSPPRLVSVLLQQHSSSPPSSQRPNQQGKKNQVVSPFDPRTVQCASTRPDRARPACPAQPSCAWISAERLPFDRSATTTPKIWIMSEHTILDTPKIGSSRHTKTKSQAAGSAPAAAGRSEEEGWSVDPVCACLCGVRVAVRTILFCI